MKSHPSPGRTELSGSSPINAQGPVPNRLWLVISLLGGIGVLLVIVSIYLFSQIVSLFGYGSDGVEFGLYVTLLLMIPLVMGIGLLYLARRLQQGDRLSRVLAVMTCLAIAAATLLTGSHDFGWTLTGLLSIGALLLLLLDPVVKGHFIGDDARYASEPVPVVAARTLMVVVAACDTFVGLAYLVLAPFDGHLIVWGIISLTIAFAVFVLSRQLAVGNPSARVVTTILAAIYFVLSFFTGQGAPGVILPVALAGSVVALLWLPLSSRSYFDRLDDPSNPTLFAIDQSLNRAASKVSEAFNGDATSN